MHCFSKLPKVIIFNIFSRLPVKSIGQFRCVSKPWRAMLSQPKLIRTHLDRSKKLRQESLSLISGSERSLFSASFSNAHHLFDEITISATKLNFADHRQCWTSVYASCDGLLLVGDAQNKMFVLNPVTKEIREVPRSPFALNPSESCIMYGFGCDSVNDDYKIVTLSYYETDNEYEADSTEIFFNVYSLKNGSWRRVESSPYDHAVGHLASGVFVNGCIHWLASETTDYKSAIVAFDLAEEKYREVPPPSSANSDKFVFNHLVMLGGCLCMFGENETDVWMMREYGVQESWTMFKIDDPEGDEVKLLCLLGQEQLVILKNNEQLVMYNIRERTSKDIVVHGIEDDLHAEASFIESLVSPHGANET